MNETKKLPSMALNDDEADQFDLVECLVAVVKNKKKIVASTIVAAAIAAAASFALPDIYKATTKLLPPQQAQSSAAAMLSQLGAVGAVAGLGGAKNPNDLYVGMLRSRTIADKLIAKYDLYKVYNKSTMEKTRQKLLENSGIASGKDGLITIDVEDTDARRAASIANSYVQELLNLTKILAVTEASQRRVFYERQLEAAKNNLATAETTLKSALDKNGVISVDAESTAIVETVGRLRAQVAAKEIQLSSMQAFVTTNNPDFRRIQEELNSLREQLAKLQNGRPGLSSDSTREEDKSGGLENIKILRDVKYYQMLYELLAKQYEVARLDEAKDPSVLQVLDGAIEPERPIRPKRVIIVLAVALAALVASIFWVVISERRRAGRLPEQLAKWEKLKSYL